MSHFDITLEMMMSDEEQKRIGVDDNVPHNRGDELKLVRILAAYDQLRTENERLKNLFERVHVNYDEPSRVKRLAEQALNPKEADGGKNKE
jgi:hypothetical protein